MAKRRARKRAAPAIAKRIEEIRVAKDITRQQLADKLGTTRLQIWRLETGVKDISAIEASAVADALGISISELYGESAA